MLLQFVGLFYLVTYFSHLIKFLMDGRKYFYNLIYLCLFTVFYPMEFRISWATDQSVSFVGPLKDLEFSLCFYSSDFANVDQNGTNLDLQHCNNDQNIMSGFIIAFLPLFFRMLQCLRQGYDNKQFIGTEFMWNFGKYTCSTMTATFSYLYKLYDHHIFFGFWMFFASSSVLYSYYWDLKHDWGFLEPNSKFKILRNKLAYHNPNIYYFVMINNLILRCTWVLSISPNTAVALGFHNKLLFTFMISFLEMFRRCQWNFLRVEKEHIKNQMAYKAVEDLSLPVNIMTNKLMLKQKIKIN
ncbi:hypothetical protein PPERSA_12248 [Pseudocohnilembus persalinus]|uniref:EXS domain-containing protein n=1 Tax=Pseudocohnilembus persalinus TaxID=266149 RepID=A0A0V0R4V2_PSEPJ|nr:hypothetical protein PPERSA_12248 [Pseudocohnilembus persalinus]|eukprot:KRX09505.1 hypothetical protein PPERSA_12248 [Pseudocohnilembus persalinus]